MKFLCTECLSNNSLHLSIFISFKYLNVQKSEVIIKVENVLSMMYLTVSDPRGINYIFYDIDFTFYITTTITPPPPTPPATSHKRLCVIKE